MFVASTPITRRVDGRALVRTLLMSTALTGLGALSAHAAPAKNETATAAAAAASPPSTGLEEVVVTARRRAEDLQTTPVSVTAFSGDLVNQLNVRTFQDLRFAVPNLEVGTLASGAASMTIRGIGQTSTQVNVDAKAGFYIDEMYVARQEGNQLYF
jgi:iron complex outermembrane receptor protein